MNTDSKESLNKIKVSFMEHCTFDETSNSFLMSEYSFHKFLKEKGIVHTLEESLEFELDFLDSFGHAAFIDFT